MVYIDPNKIEAFCNDLVMQYDIRMKQDTFEDYKEESFYKDIIDQFFSKDDHFLYLNITSDLPLEYGINTILKYISDEYGTNTSSMLLCLNCGEDKLAGCTDDCSGTAYYTMV